MSAVERCDSSLLVLFSSLRQIVMLVLFIYLIDEVSDELCIDRI